jgi:hypothetical protein
MTDNTLSLTRGRSFNDKSISPRLMTMKPTCPRPLTSTTITKGQDDWDSSLLEIEGL